MWSIELIVVGLMIVLNSVFAAYEIALASVGEGRLHTLEKERQGGAKAALRMKQKMEASLAVVQIGITLVGAIAAATSGAGAEEAIEPTLREWGFSAKIAQFLAIALVVAPLVVVTILFGELVPKVFALRNKEWICLTLSPFMQWFSYCVWPAVWFLETSVRGIVWLFESRKKTNDEEDDPAIQELHSAASLARVMRLIGHRQEGIILSATRLAESSLREVMLPAQYIGMLSLGQSLGEALITAHQEMHTRFPITEEPGNPQKIIGYVNFKDIVVALRLSDKKPTLADLVRRLPSYDVDTPVADCLEHLIRERNHIALVRDTNQRVVGLVTLEDIIEELVGEIHDEYDRIPAHLTPVGQGWISGGFVSLLQLQNVTGIKLPSLGEKPIYTVSDWIVQRLGRPPQGGDELMEDGFRIVVRKTRHIFVQEAFVTRTVTDETAMENEDADLEPAADRT
jgi:putative hemolysin